MFEQLLMNLVLATTQDIAAVTAILGIIFGAICLMYWRFSKHSSNPNQHCNPFSVMSGLTKKMDITLCDERTERIEQKIDSCNETITVKHEALKGVVEKGFSHLEDVINHKKKGQ